MTTPALSAVKLARRPAALRCLGLNINCSGLNNTEAGRSADPAREILTDHRRAPRRRLLARRSDAWPFRTSWEMQRRALNSLPTPTTNSSLPTTLFRRSRADPSLAAQPQVDSLCRSLTAVKGGTVHPDDAPVRGGSFRRHVESGTCLALSRVWSRIRTDQPESNQSRNQGPATRAR